VSSSPWQQRIARADVLTRAYPFAAEILSFYAHVARLQERLYQRLESGSQLPRLASDLPHDVDTQFLSFLGEMEDVAPRALTEMAGQLREASLGSLANLLNAVWQRTETSPSQPEEFLARAFLQPYAVLARANAGSSWKDYNRSVCPFCGRKPGAGILKPMGDGGSRWLLCSFCLAEWEFRRIVCAGCGEEDYQKLPVYTAADFDYFRVECCETCKQYLKTVDLTKNGLAEPVVDEIAAAPLDLWAREQGYAKMEPNLMGM
jgi:FdhE protein